jgi:Anticodon binding domain
VLPFLEANGCKAADGPPLAGVIPLLRERANSLRELADGAVPFYRALEPSAALRQQYYSAEARPALVDLQGRLHAIVWNRAAISDAIKGVVAAHGQTGDAAARDGHRRDADAAHRRDPRTDRQGARARAHGRAARPFCEIAFFTPVTTHRYNPRSFVGV